MFEHIYAYATEDVETKSGREFYRNIILFSP